MPALPFPNACWPRSAAGAGVPRRGVRRIVPAALLLLLLASAARAAAADGIYPLILRDDRGVAVTLRRPPARVVSLAPSLTEIVFFLGKEKILVGVTRFCNYPPAAARLPRVGGVTDPDVERIVAARPDLVLCTLDGNPRDRVRALEEAGIRCFAVGPQNLAAVFSLVERVGILLGVPGKARAAATELEARANRASARGRNDAAGAAGPGAGPKAVFILSVSPLIAAGPGTFLDELLRLSGARNAASSFTVRYPRLSTEDLIVLGTHLFDMMRIFAGDPLWVSSHVTYNEEELTARHVHKASEDVGPIAGNRISANIKPKRKVAALFKAD